MANQRIIRVDAAHIQDDPGVVALLQETRANARAFIFLSGGASKMSAADERAVLSLFDALVTLAGEPLPFAVGDGGTQAGIMQAAGHARARSPRPFPLIGVSPAREIPPLGVTPVDPNHSAIIAIDNPDWAGVAGYFGSETAAMYQLFASLAQGRPSVTVVANGGGITLREVDENIGANRPMILVAGSGRAADALVSILNGATSDDPEIVTLRAEVLALRLTRRADLFQIFDLAEGPVAFADTLRASFVR